MQNARSKCLWIFISSRVEVLAVDVGYLMLMFVERHAIYRTKVSACEMKMSKRFSVCVLCVRVRGRCLRSAGRWCTCESVCSFGLWNRKTIFLSSVACFHLLRDFPVGAHSPAASMTRIQKYEFLILLRRKSFVVCRTVYCLRPACCR